MKKSMLILLTVLCAVACRKITPEERISQISGYFAQQEDSYATKIEQYGLDKRVDYLTLVLAKEIKAGDIWTLETEEGRTLVADFPAKAKSEGGVAVEGTALVSASLDDPTACAAALDVFKAFKKLRVQRKSPFRLVFYDSEEGLSAVNQELREASEMAVFDFELSSRDSLPADTFVLEEKDAFFARMQEVIPPYLAPLGDYRLEPREYMSSDWPLKTSVYRYGIRPDNFQKDAAAATAFVYLLN